MKTEDTARALDAAHPSQQFLRFMLDGGFYTVRIDMVREILEVAQMTPLPLMPEFVRGVMNLRGMVIPVIDLSARLGLRRTVIGRRTCVVIADVVTSDGSSRQSLGMLVDSVQEVVDVAMQDQESVPRLGTGIDPSFLHSLVRVRGESTPELNLSTVLDIQTLGELIGQHSAPQPGRMTSTPAHEVAGAAA